MTVDLRTSDLQPPTGPPGTLAQRVAQYVSRFDPGWFSRCRPASAADIDFYERLAGFGTPGYALPASFRAFLQHFGEDDDGLLEQLGIDSSIQTLLGASRRRRRHYPLPESTFAIAGEYYSLREPPICFDLRTGLEEPPIIEEDDEDEAEPFADSWESFVMACAMVRVESLRLPNGRWSSSTRSTTERALHSSGHATSTAAFDRIAEEHRLILAWPSDDRRRIAVSERFSVVAQMQLGTVLLRLHASDPSLLSRIGDDFEQGLGTYGGAPFDSDGIEGGEDDPEHR